MKHNIKHLPLFFSRLSPVIVLLFALALVPGLHAQASSISLDQNFNTPFFALPVLPGRAVLLPDGSGRYVMFFNLDTLADQSTGPLMRFYSDGTLDTTFSFSHDYSGVTAVALTADGKLIVAASKTVYGVADSAQHQKTDILRLCADGSIDPSFGPAQATDGAEVRIITVNADGTIFVGGKFTAFNGQPNYGVVRLLPKYGTVDPAFAPVTMTCSANPFSGSRNCGIWAAPVIDGDSKIIIAGDFVSVDGVNALGVARLKSDGTLDTGFNASGFAPSGFFAGTPRPIRGIAIQSDGKVVIGGRFQVDASFASNPTGNVFNRLPLIRLNTDGSADQSYGYFGFLPPDGLIQVRNLIIQQPGDKVIAVSRSVWRFNAHTNDNTDGSLDPMFYNVALLLQQQFDTDIASAEAFNIALTSDGGFFIGGIFTDVDDANGPPNGERWGAAKLHADGTLDTSFTTSHKVGSKIEPGNFTRESDGSILTAFNSLGYDTLHPAIPHNLGRLLSNGTLDGTFDPLAALNPNGPLSPNFMALGFTGLSDGGLLVTGLHGATANYGHLLANDTEDPNYHADPTVKFATAYLRSDGEIIVSGFYPNLALGFKDPSAENAAAGTQVQLIKPDGSLDTTNFHLDASIVNATQERDANGNLLSIRTGSAVLALMASDKILFGYLSSDGSYHLVRLDKYGSIDPSFAGVTFPVSVSLGANTFVDPQHPEVGFQTITTYLTNDTPVKQAKTVLDSKIVLMGSFSSYTATPAATPGATPSTTPAHGLLRINSDGLPDPTFTIGSGAQWTQTPETDTLHPSIDNLEVGLDDKLLLTGTFEAFKGMAAPGIISLNPDGTIDTSFVPSVKRQKFDYQPAYLARQSNGSFLLSGPYSQITDNKSPSFFRLLLPPGVPTPTGSNVTVNEGSVGSASNITVNFGTVCTSCPAGTTSVSVIDPNWAGQLPQGFQVAGANLAFEVYTTSMYTSPVTVCFTLSSLDPAIFAAANVWHNNGSGLVNVTSSKDSTTQTICATVPSLSPFVILTPPYKAKIQPPINVNGGSVFSVKLGAIPVKFTLTSNGVATCQLPPATISLIRTAGAAPGPIPVSKYRLPSDSGSNFRIDTTNCQYVYNLTTSSLGTGTYRVSISIAGTVVGSGTFALK
jgi:uncharacterized delta-60 repeat protein